MSAAKPFGQLDLGHSFFREQVADHLIHVHDERISENRFFCNRLSDQSRYNNPGMETLGARDSRARKERGMTQKQLAKLSGLL